LRARASDDDAIERGFTLVEMLITVWILGAVIVTMCGAIFTMIKGSDYANRTTLAETELRRYADAVRAAPYQDCAGVPGYANSDDYAATRSAPTAGTIDTAPVVHFWKSGATDDVSTWLDNTNGNNGVQDGTHCNSSGIVATGDTGAQLIQLTVTVSGSPTIQVTSTIAKRDGSS
jgi:prepilin-type N-terminal cleavage/methylation domain-containing protein